MAVLAKNKAFGLVLPMVRALSSGYQEQEPKEQHCASI